MNRILKDKLNINITNMIELYILPSTNYITYLKYNCMSNLKFRTWSILDDLNYNFRYDGFGFCKVNFNNFKIIKLKNHTNIDNAWIMTLKTDLKDNRSSHSI